MLKYIFTLWTFVELPPLKLFHLGRREVEECIYLMEDKWDELMLFDASMYDENAKSHVADASHWDPTQVYGVHGKMPHTIGDQWKQVRTQRSDELSFTSEYELKRLEAYLKLNQKKGQNLQLISVRVRRLFGRLCLNMGVCNGR